jgi:F-type H+-transporting ATPase subunit delta
VAGVDPIVAGMAGRYASALFELAREAKTVDAVRGDLDRFAALLAESPDLKRLVRSPVFSAEEQLRALTVILERAALGPLVVNFLKLVTTNRRLYAIGDMIKAFAVLHARHKGEVTAAVTVAEPLGDKQRRALEEALKSVTSENVALAVTVDPAIIGGLIVKLGSRMVDTSLRTKLNSIRQAMKGGG